MTDDFLPVPDRRSEFTPETYTRAFHVWAWEVDRSYTLTAKRLEALEAIAAELEQREPTKTPNTDTVRFWAITDDWPKRAHDILASNGNAKRMMERHFGQLLVMGNTVLERYAEILHLDPEDPKNHPGILKAGEQVFKALRYFGNNAEASPDAPALTPDRALNTGPRDRETVSQEQLERIQRAKHERKGKS